jgi:hypothetical protein
MFLFILAVYRIYSKASFNLSIKTVGKLFTDRIYNITFSAQNRV